VLAHKKSVTGRSDDIRDGSWLALSFEHEACADEHDTSAESHASAEVWDWLACLVGTWHPYRDVAVSPDGLAELRAELDRAERVLPRPSGVVAGQWG
jgi:hypothetical protein